MKINNNEMPTKNPPWWNGHLQSQVSRRLDEIFQGQQTVVYKGAVPTEPPEWLDSAKFEKGKAFFRHYLSGVFLAHLISLVLSLCGPQILKPLMFTRKSDTAWRAFHRYVRTVVYVYSWYIYDVWSPDPESPGRKSIGIVRDLHSKAADTVNHPDNKEHVQHFDMQTLVQGTQSDLLTGKTNLLPALGVDLKSCVPDPNLPLHPNYFATGYPNDAHCPFLSQSSAADSPIEFVNQTDMSLTQYAFVGLMVMYPEKFGASSATVDDLECFIHFWRGIGYLLGIDDRYNFCRDDDYHFTRELCFLTAERVIKPQLARVGEEYEHMSRALLKGTRYYLPLYTLECIVLYVSYLLQLPIPNAVKVVPWSAWFSYWYLRIVFSVLCKIPVILKLYNCLLYFALLMVVNPPPNTPLFLRPPHIRGLEEFFP